MSVLPPRVLEAIFALVKELPPTALNGVATELDSIAYIRERGQLTRLGNSQGLKDRLANFADIALTMPGLEGNVVAGAIRAMGYAVEKISAEQSLEIAWTGPGTEAVPLRRVDQVLYELIGGAQSELLLVTYAAYKAEHALTALRAATDRGVEVTLVLELADQSGGKIAFDGLEMVRYQVPKARVYWWPVERRARNASGNYGTMHAKCLVVDRKVALVSSANLTDHALDMNMELGLLVRGSSPGRLSAHFEQLVLRGELSPVKKA